MQRLSATAAKAHLDSDPGTILLDVREPWEVERAKVEGAITIPMAQIPGALDRLDRNRCIIVLCHHGARSLQVVTFLERSGYAQVANLEGGIDAWATDVDHAVPRY